MSMVTCVSQEARCVQVRLCCCIPSREMCIFKYDAHATCVVRTFSLCSAVGVSDLLMCLI